MLSNSNHEETPLIANGASKASNISDYQSASSKDSRNNIWVTNDQRKRKPLCRDCVQAWRKCNRKCTNRMDCTYIGNKSYDLLNIIITAADIVSDTLVIYNFYQNKQMAFFWVGVAIIILAQICSAIAFWLRYVEKKKSKTSYIFLWLILAFIFSPLLGFVVFLTSSRNSWLSRVCINHIPGLVPPFSHTGEENTKLIKTWVDAKTDKHFGFIMECIFESFPQVLSFCNMITFFSRLVTFWRF